MSLTAADVAEIMRLVEQSGFDELTLEIDGMKLSLRRGGSAEGAAGGVGSARSAAALDAAAGAQRVARKSAACGGRQPPAARMRAKAPVRRSQRTRRTLTPAWHLLSRAEARSAAVRGGRRAGRGRDSRRHHRGDEADEHGARRRARHCNRDTARRRRARRIRRDPAARSQVRLVAWPFAACSSPIAGKSLCGSSARAGSSTSRPFSPPPRRIVTACRRALRIARFA